jgi:hypothetical protein
MSAYTVLKLKHDEQYNIFTLGRTLLHRFETLPVIGFFPLLEEDPLFPLALVGGVVKGLVNSFLLIPFKAAKSSSIVLFFESLR